MGNPWSDRSSRAGRPQRADARLNRDRILDVADEVFGKSGAAASTDEVARLAGVGIATVFRHFPTKAALLEAVFVRRLERLRDEANRAMVARDPGEAFFDFFARTVAGAATKIAIADALEAEGARADIRTTQAAEELRNAIGALLERAQQTGAVRDDIELPELYALLVGTSRAAAHAGLDSSAQARTLSVIFDGLAPGRARAGPEHKH